MKPHLLLWTLSLLTVMAPVAQARVKLVALPDRARVVISLTNPSATLVEEERVLTLQKGVNQIDFSWSGVNIDADSIQARILGKPDVVQFLDTSYPPNETALIWEIYSPAAQEERVRISYLLQGLGREIAYRAVAEPDETRLTLRSFFRLHNDSGEDFAGAQLRIGYGTDFEKPIENGEVIEMLSERIESVPIKKTLTWDAASQPWDPEYEKNTAGLPLSYVINNDPASKLGAHTLLPGKARLFLRTGEQGGNLAFTGEDWAGLTPINREMKLYVGQSRDVKITQRRMKEDRVNVRRNNSNQVVACDTEEQYKIDIENFKKTPVNLVIVEHVSGSWKMARSSHEYTKTDAFTIEYRLTLPKESFKEAKTTVTFSLNRLNVQGNEPSSY